jgi:hypothetical protein
MTKMITKNYTKIFNMTNDYMKNDILERLKVEYCGSKKRARFLRISGLRQFFQILEIILLSAPNWHAKCMYIFV